ncbi:MAG: HAMP domain-containing histidine kinase [Flavobacteriales bacterium]|nr:HAMP domain-containing histidine kinase [Flavobacteriales bacterium]
MSLRNRLTLQFGLLASLVLGVASIAIYFLSADYRKDEFSQRLISRGENMAKLLIQIEEVDQNLLNIIECDNPVRLPEEQILIFNFRDSLIYSSEGLDIEMPTKDFLNQVRLDGSIQISKEKRESEAFLFTDRYDRFVVIVSGIDVYGRRKIQNLGQVLAIVLGLGMIAFFLVGRVYAERALSPIKQLVAEIAGISISNLNKRANEGNGSDELAKLAISFNAMLARLEAAFVVQRNFIANASHEMRTPLTAISGQLEVILLKQRSEEEYKVAIESVLQDIHKLNKLANRLLMLAQTGTDAPEANFRQVRIDDIIWEVRADLKKMKPDYCIEVDLDETITDLEELQVLGSDILLKALILNLMENGCKYSDDHVVKVSLGVRANTIQLTFTDNGIGISEADLKQIFDPFFRSNSIRNRDGHGIGLSLVKRICDLHKGTIKVSSVLGKGSTFTVSLPIKKV